VDAVDTPLLERLAVRLERQLDALRHACFRLEVLQAVVTVGKREWLPESNADLAQALDALQQSDRELRVALGETARSLGLSPEATLREVAVAAPEPWDFVFAKHREVVDHLARRADELGRACNQLLRQLLATLEAALTMIGGEAPVGYDETGGQGPVTGSIGLVDTRT
jgi:hypothetical protein